MIVQCGKDVLCLSLDVFVYLLPVCLFVVTCLLDHCLLT